MSRPGTTIQTASPRHLPTGIGTGDLRQVNWADFSAFVLSPGVPLTHPKPHWTVDLAHSAGVEIIGDVELFVRERRAHAPDCPFIAITGTNGKSTTTALIAHILKASGRDTQLGGNIGTAVLTLDPPAADRFYVVECSSYQIDLAPTLNPSAGILLNLTPDHLDRHGSMEHYADIKERLIAGSDTAIVGVDDVYTEAIADRADAFRAPRHPHRPPSRPWRRTLCRRHARHARRGWPGVSRCRSRRYRDLARQSQCAECGRRDCGLPVGRRFRTRNSGRVVVFPGV